MKETRYFYVPQASVQNELPADEAVHALRVLRLASGVEMFLMDGDGGIYRAKVTMTSSKHCFYASRQGLARKHPFGHCPNQDDGTYRVDGREGHRGWS